MVIGVDGIIKITRRPVPQLDEVARIQHSKPYSTPVYTFMERYPTCCAAKDRITALLQALEEAVGDEKVSLIVLQAIDQ